MLALGVGTYAYASNVQQAAAVQQANVENDCLARHCCSAMRPAPFTTCGSTMHCGSPMLVAIPGVRYWRTQRALQEPQLAELAHMDTTTLQRIEDGDPTDLQTVEKDLRRWA